MWFVAQSALRGERPRDVIRRSTIIALVSFLTLSAFFSAQALLPQLVEAYGTDAATMGVAVNAVTAAGDAMAAYITGNVAANLFGRVHAGSAVDLFGLTGFFWIFAVLNIAGAILALSLFGPRDTRPPMRTGSPAAAWRKHFAKPALRSAFAMGFAILFVLVGVFTYVNLYLTQVLRVDELLLGLVCLVFLPAPFTTPYAAALPLSSALRRPGPVVLPKSIIERRSQTKAQQASSERDE